MTAARGSWYNTAPAAPGGTCPTPSPFAQPVPSLAGLGGGDESILQ